MRRVDWIVVHHTAGPDHPDTLDTAAIRRWHVEGRGWRDIGYHVLVERVDGVPTAVFGRPWRVPGAHCPPRNRDSIGVAIVGDFSTSPPHAELRFFVVALLADLCEVLGVRPDRVVGHREAQPGHTACPGALDMGAIREALRVERAG